MKISQEGYLGLAEFFSALTKYGFQPDPEALHQNLLEGLCRLFSVESAALYLLDESGKEWLVRRGYVSEAPQSEEEQAQKAIGWIHQVESWQGTRLVRNCMERKASILANRIQNNPEFEPSRDAPAEFQVNSMLCSPLIDDGIVLGVLQLLNKRDQEFLASDRDLLEIIASQVVTLLEGAKTFRNMLVANRDVEVSRWELLRSREILRKTFDFLPMALYIVDQDYQLVAVNQKRAVQINESPQVLENQICYRVLFNRFEPCRDCRIKETFLERASTQRTEMRNLSGAIQESDRRVEDGIEWEINTYPIYDDQGEVIYSIVMEQNVTEKYLLENILARSEKLAVIGQLAAGLAHEINNPLTAIIANAQILQRELPADNDLQESVDLISRAGARAAQVVRNLLDFARKEDFHLGLIDVNETVERALELIRHEIMSRNIQLIFTPDPSLPTILASEDHLQSVWLNLLLNAIDALDKPSASIIVQTRKEGAEILVSIADNGKGISPQRLTNIFEPFYTTKAPGRGTGLGLSVSHRIVKQHGGTIRVESKSGSGSEFTVILPMS